MDKHSGVLGRDWTSLQHLLTSSHSSCLPGPQSSSKKSEQRP